MAWTLVRDLGAISRCEIPFGCTRDCAEIVHLVRGHREALPPHGACRACNGDIRNGRVCSDSTKWPSTVVIGAWVHLGAFWLVCASCRKSRSNTHAPITTILGHFVESEQTRPFRISPLHALHAPCNGNASQWPRTRCTISAQSRYHEIQTVSSEIARLRRDSKDAAW